MVHGTPAEAVILHTKRKCELHQCAPSALINRADLEVKL